MLDVRCWLRTPILLLAAAAFAASPTRIVLVAGKPSHGAGQHEFNAGTLLLEKCLRQNKGIETLVVRGGWPEDEKVFDGASIHVEHDAGRAVEIPKEKGGDELLDWIGGYYERPYSQNPINEVPVTQASPRHPISRGWKSFSGKDEWYYLIRFRPDDKRVTPIMTTMLPKEAPHTEALAWAVERSDGGRGFGFTGAHFHSNWGIPDFRKMVVNAILWSAKVNVPGSGAKCDVTPQDLQANQDPK